MGRKTKYDARIPSKEDLIEPTFKAIRELGGSGNNEDILAKIIEDLELPDEVAEIPHKDRISFSELGYRAAWAKTYLRNAGIITNSARSVWSVTSEYAQTDHINGKYVVDEMHKRKSSHKSQPEEKEKTVKVPDGEETDNSLDTAEAQPWRDKLARILQTMDPFGFERLTQRILRECGFSQVEITKKTGDGGIDGTGKLKINGIFSFNVAFQCKRYAGKVSSAAVRDFRGSLTTDIEKGVLITTGMFSKDAKAEASNPGKQQIDLIDGEELINKIAEYGIGVKEVKSYEIDEDFFENI